MAIKAEQLEEGAAVGMRGDHRPVEQFERLPEALLGHMAHIECDPGLGHFAHQYAPFISQRAGVAGAAAVARALPGRPNDAYSQCLPFRNLRRMQNRVGPFHQHNNALNLLPRRTICQKRGKIAPVFDHPHIWSLGQRAVVGKLIACLLVRFFRGVVNQRRQTGAAFWRNKQRAKDQTNSTSKRIRQAHRGNILITRLFALANVVNRHGVLAPYRQGVASNIKMSINYHLRFWIYD